MWQQEFIWFFTIFHQEFRKNNAIAFEVLMVLAVAHLFGFYNPKQLETIASLPGFGMAPVGHLSYSAGPNMRARRTQPCSVRVRIDPIPPKGLPRLPTCQCQRSSSIVVITSSNPVHAVVTQPIGTSRPNGHYTTWGISTS